MTSRFSIPMVACKGRKTAFACAWTPPTCNWLRKGSSSDEDRFPPNGSGGHSGASIAFVDAIFELDVVHRWRHTLCAAFHRPPQRESGRSSRSLGAAVDGWSQGVGVGAGRRRRSARSERVAVRADSAQHVVERYGGQRAPIPDRACPACSGHSAGIAHGRFSLFWSGLSALRAVL